MPCSAQGRGDRLLEARLGVGPGAAEEALDGDGGVAEGPADRATALVTDEPVDALGAEALVHRAQLLGDDRVSHGVGDVDHGAVTERRS